ncbi:MAG: gamma-glutamyl-gamma-aminobutyrate hydrolase family protein [Nitrosopumilus sp.]|uniref:type 1 glutamine amidotransferase n=1 Tax=Nitrosopumilus sp. TaxID=2024843 RepID=UPI00246A9BF5|nr:gamma-glutamyl-gamma-aminobutyrate hydrolase family protein [Nitrosopumilus sp.]MDH5430818.1 gamma-glutamyl-gamma-aminobutyrate hydrolase family protein [Nitrosopumilus sp.]MDH5665089.1 gamma-glutamyl-gamma-aminobutyrate hydrolase family protein [Nitrosopumilus sp.]MDH5697212.1 gamma-glutamyl-gamma-aminobutyrate hydrolase family protein [Nitrosopumilus sp.]
MLLVVDNGSIYTKKLTDFLIQKNISFEKQSPQILNLNFLSNYDSFILSGRRKNEKKINEINSKIITYCIKNNSKLLGICYGAEILALTLGGTIRKTHSLKKGNESIQIMIENPICKNSISVFESHSYEISKLPTILIPLAKSKNCKYEIIQYEKKPIFGTQFHPEMSQDGNNLIEKFCLL